LNAEHNRRGDAMPPTLWGFFVGALIAVGLGLLIPDVMTAVGGAVVFGLFGAILAWLGSILLRRARGSVRR
jgi:hypothetical protein